MAWNHVWLQGRRTSVPAALLVLSAWLVVACGDDTLGTGPSLDETVYAGTILVLEDTEHGPQLCGFQQDSYPPQCGGIEVANWDWDDVDGEESASGTTWGSFHVVGTYAEGVFTLTADPGLADTPWGYRVGTSLT